jgi:hypothetical protein
MSLLRLDWAPIFSVFTDFLVFGYYSSTFYLTGDEIDRDHDRVYALEDSLAPITCDMLTFLSPYHPQIERYTRLKNRVVEDE